MNFAAVSGDQLPRFNPLLWPATNTGTSIRLTDLGSQNHTAHLGYSVYEIFEVQNQS